MRSFTGTASSAGPAFAVNHRRGSPVLRSGPYKRKKKQIREDPREKKAEDLTGVVRFIDMKGGLVLVGGTALEA